jgi:FMN phosphatase YigB (HAD superfamily)
VLAPSLLVRPYNFTFAGGDWRLFIYPVADAALEPHDPLAPPTDVLRLHRALGDDTRLRILRLLRDRDWYLTEIAERLELSKPTIKHHLAQLRAAGLRLGVVGNHPAAATETMLPEVSGAVDLVGSSERWGVEKPSPAFFERVVAEVGLEPAAIAYVGDRLDNDVLPAMALGMVGVFLVRGPWGLVQQSWPEAAQADFTVHHLNGLARPLGVR